MSGFRHVVLFTWNDTVDDEHLAAIKAGLATLPGLIPEIAAYGFVTHITKLVGEIVGVVKRNRIPYGDRGVVIELATGDGAAT